MPRRGSARADAIRRAHQAKAARDAARQHREALIESALADYYQAAAQADRLRDTARRKAGDLLADAGRAAAPHQAEAAAAVRRLRDLLGGVTETAQLCGVTTAMVRDILAGHAPAASGDSGTPPQPVRPAPAGPEPQAGPQPAAPAGTGPQAGAQPAAGGDRGDS